MKLNKLLWLLFAPVFILSCSKSGTEYVNNPGSPEYLHTRPVGASAKEILASDKYQSLVVEILYMPGYAPDAGAVEHLRGFLTDLVNKPGGITITTKEIPAQGNATMTLNDIIEVERTRRSAFISGSQVAISIIYTNSDYSNPNTLGVAYRNTSAAIFGKTIHENSGGLTQVSRYKLEATILKHEVGHLLGLVDLGSSMQVPHKDASHGNHCNNSNCLMYYASETTEILGFLLTGTVPELDSNCRADLTANGGR
jgi:hypothetical protein